MMTIATFKPLGQFQQLSNFSEYESTLDSKNAEPYRKKLYPSFIDLGKLDLSMSAKEMKQTLERRRKKDPRREDKGDIRRRFQMTQEL